MNHLTASHSISLNNKKFNLETYFYTDTYIFKNFKIEKNIRLIIETLLAIILLILFFPIMILVSGAIKVMMKGNVLYSQIRVGENGKKFKIYKFRSMVEDAEAISGPRLSNQNDSRVTSLGKFLRASHLDELPQLFNVILGEMSFVGPRPERPEFVNVFENEITDYKKREKVKPGITGLAQVCLGYDAKANEKLVYDMIYIENRASIIFNIIICYYTATKMLTFFKNM